MRFHNVPEGKNLSFAMFKNLMRKDIISVQHAEKDKKVSPNTSKN